MPDLIDISLIDIGANLTHESFDADRAAVLERARANGVTRLIVTGTSVTASAQALELAQELPGTLYATAGVHPHHAAELDAHGVDAERAGISREEDDHRDEAPVHGGRHNPCGAVQRRPAHGPDAEGAANGDAIARLVWMR